MPYVIGAGLALAVCFFATLAGFDRDRAFYPTLTVVIASYYALFAVMGGLPGALGVESVVIFLFLLVSVLGFKLNLWVVVAALWAHGVFDFVHRCVVSHGADEGDATGAANSSSKPRFFQDLAGDKVGVLTRA